MLLLLLRLEHRRVGGGLLRLILILGMSLPPAAAGGCSRGLQWRASTAPLAACSALVHIITIATFAPILLVWVGALPLREADFAAGVAARVT